MKRRAIWFAGTAAVIAIVVSMLFIQSGYFRVPYGFLVPDKQALQASEQHVQRGIRLYKQKSYPEAIYELRQALDGNPREWRAPYYMGVIEIDFKQFPRAIPYLEQAFAMNPAEAQIPYTLGVTYYKLGRIDMAKGYFAAALELDPGNDDARALFDTMAQLQRNGRLAAK